MKTISHNGQGPLAGNLSDLEKDGEVSSSQTADLVALNLKLAQENARLTRERDLLRLMIDNLPDYIYAKDKQGRFVLNNHAHASDLGARTAADMVGKSDFDFFPKELAAQFFADEQKIIKTGEPVINQEQYKSRPGFAATAKRWSVTTKVLWRDPQGNILGTVGITRDIHKMKSAQEALRESEEKLRQSQKMETVGQLAAGVAHDFNNILTVIQGHTELLLVKTPPATPAAKSLIQIAAAAERAAGFVRHLLLFSHKQVFQTKVLDLNLTLRDLEHMLPRMLGGNVSMETSYHPSLPCISADAGMIEQILMNLAVNARDAMPKGGDIRIMTAPVEVSEACAAKNPEARPGSFVCLSVQDTGSGIEARLLPRIFEPFFTTKENGKGTGLGLATVYGIVKQHQGWIEVDSQIGLGTTFRIYLPANGDTAPAPANPTASPTDTELFGGDETILLVEDEASLLDLTRQILQRFHFHVLTAASGEEALRVWDAHSGKIDLLLTDMVMPGELSGGDLVAELKKRQPALKAIVTSGYSSELIDKDFAQSDMVFLPKPYQPQQLARLVRNTLDTSGCAADSSPKS